jgi:hypothetical protein
MQRMQKKGTMSEDLTHNPPTPIGPKGVTPETVLDHMKADIHDVDEIYCVTIKKDASVRLHIAGSMKGCTYAGAVLTDVGLKGFKC